MSAGMREDGGDQRGLGVARLGGRAPEGAEFRDGEDRPQLPQAKPGLRTVRWSV